MRKPDHLVEGRFRITTILAKGGMGETYLAWDELASCPVVVKYPRSVVDDRDGLASRFDREVEACRSLAHRHVVPVVASGADDGSPYLVMPLLAGGSLADRIGRGQDGCAVPSNPASLRDWLPDIAAALDHAHERGIIHRDVKPANIFFDAGGAAFLGDFGIVKSLEDHASAEESLTRTNIAMGTHYYMAPERYKARCEPSGRADQYSLAICVYEVLAGRRPFLGETDHVAVEHAVKPPPPLPRLRGMEPPATLCRAIERALAKNPANRFENCVAFAQAALLDVPETKREEGVSEMLCPNCRRLIRLRAEVAGRRGKCSRCQAPLMISPTCDWLWRADEMPGRETPSIERTAEVSPTPSGPEPRRRWAAAAVGTAAALTVVGLFALWRSHRSPQQPNSPEVVQFVGEVTAEPSGEPQDAGHSGTVAGPTVEVPEDHTADSSAEHARPDAAALPPNHDLSVEAVGNAPPSHPTAASEGDGAEHVVVDDTAAAAHAESTDHTKNDTPEAAPQPALSADVEPRNEIPSLDVFPTEAIRELHWVLVDHPGNAADTNGLGGVDRSYLFGRYEVTNDEYCTFLNRTEAGRRNLHGVADGPERPADLASPADCDRGIIRSVDADGRFSYRAAPYMGDKPVVNLRWCDAARLANWLHNGGADNADTETGAYELAGAMLDESKALAPTPDARVWIPSIDEWYKAAFAKYKNGRCIGYWKYPTGSGTKPRPVAADEYGVGEAVVGTPRNTANITKRSRWPKEPLQHIKKNVWQSAGAVTSVGTNGRPSDVGAYDMAGNACELVTRAGEDTAAIASLAGGDFTMQGQDDDYLSSTAATKWRRGRGGIRLACVVDPAIPLRPARATIPFARMAKAIDAALKPLRYLRTTPPNNVLAADANLLVKDILTVDRLNLSTEVTKVLDRTQEVLEQLEQEAKRRDTELQTLNATTKTASLVMGNLLGPDVVPRLAAYDQRTILDRFADVYEQLRARARQLEKAANAIRITPAE